MNETDEPMVSVGLFLIGVFVIFFIALSVTDCSKEAPKTQKRSAPSSQPSSSEAGELKLRYPSMKPAIQLDDSGLIHMDLSSGRIKFGPSF